jgi:pimeloyl-ACP methyl ester carboxylesterase
MNEAVVLVHGIWFHSLTMVVLDRRLRRCGFETWRFGYSSVNASPQENAARLQEFVQQIDASVVHFVGHSLGGLVILRLFHEFPQQRPGRVVLLGTPLAGSRIARKLAERFGGRQLLGRSIEQGLLGDGPSWSGQRELGVVAGTAAVGVGLLLGGLDEPNDGTVAVRETQIAGVSDHVLVRTSHTGLLFSPAAARQVCHFLETGHFLGSDF